MATLKVAILKVQFPSLLKFPWMKIHGNIEGLRYSSHQEISYKFPWMKIHGNIEGLTASDSVTIIGIISMNENSWQHWRDTDYYHIHAKRFISMNENSWQHWRGCVETKVTFGDWFPWMKIHGNIEGCQSWFACWSACPISMNENSWQHWRTYIFSHSRQPLAPFPWMKIHGNIEGA